MILPSPTAAAAPPHTILAYASRTSIYQRVCMSLRRLCRAAAVCLPISPRMLSRWYPYLVAEQNYTATASDHAHSAISLGKGYTLSRCHCYSLDAVGRASRRRSSHKNTHGPGPRGAREDRARRKEAGQGYKRTPADNNNNNLCAALELGVLKSATMRPRVRQPYVCTTII